MSDQDIPKDKLSSYLAGGEKFKVMEIEAYVFPMVDNKWIDTMFTLLNKFLQILQ